MVKSVRGNGPRAVFESDADSEFGAAIKALQEAAWRLRMASYQVEQEHIHRSSSSYRPMETSACMAIAETLATQVESVGTQTRRLRKRAREI